MLCFFKLFKYYFDKCCDLDNTQLIQVLIINHQDNHGQAIYFL